jgi:hypothetical protein
MGGVWALSGSIKDIPLMIRGRRPPCKCALPPKCLVTEVMPSANFSNHREFHLIQDTRHATRGSDARFTTSSTSSWLGSAAGM